MKARKFLTLFVAATLAVSSFVMPAAASSSDEEYAQVSDKSAISELVVYKDSTKTEKYASVDDIPRGAVVYYDIVSKPGYICYDIKMNVYEITDTYFVNDYHGVQLDYTLMSVLAGDTDLSGTYTLADATDILKYIAGYTPQYWALGRSAYGECIMDYTCDGKINLSDVSGVLKDIAGWDIDRNNPCPRTYGLEYLLPVDAEAFYGVEVKYLGYGGYVVEHGDAYGLSDKYDDAFFETHDLVIFNGYCPGDAEPVIDKLWYNSDTTFVSAEFECSNIQFGSGWAIFVPVVKELQVIPNYPM